MGKLIGNPEDDDSYYHFIAKLDLLTKIEVLDFSLKASRYNLITVKIVRKINNKWSEIGKAQLVVENLGEVKWGDIMIGSDEEYDYIGPISIPNNNYKYRKFRNKGIGSKVVQYMLKYLKQNGIKIIHGEISSRDDYEIASNFWKKHNFIIKKYKKPKGVIIAKISCRL